MPAPGQRRTNERSTLLRAPRRDPNELQALRELLVPTSKSLGGALPEAIAHASQQRAGELSTAIAKPVTGALRDLARREPELFGEILAPSIGTAVRRAVSDAITALLQRMNHVVERSLSVRSWKWRIEAKRTGRSFAEIALAHTLVYRVEWVVLIHTETSLVLEQATLAEAPPPEPDQISAMLNAISAFVSEAFQPASPGAELHTVEVGDLTLWVERDPALTLAAAIRGNAPIDLRAVLRETLDRVRTLHADDVGRRMPDVGSYADTRPLLVDCLKQQLHPRPKRWRMLRAIAVVALLAALVVLVARPYVRAREAVDLAGMYRAAFSRTPGIVVTSVGLANGNYRIEGLRDPRAEVPELVVARAGLPPAQLAFAPFESLDPRFEGPLAVVDGAVRELEQLQIVFDRKRSTVDPSDAPVRRAAELIERARRAAATARMSLCIEVRGHTDETGSLAVNMALRKARAAAVVDALHAAGVAREVLYAYAADWSREPTLVRRATFRASLRPDPTTRGCPP